MRNAHKKNVQLVFAFALTIFVCSFGRSASATVDFEHFTVDGSPYLLTSEDSYHGYDSQPSPADELPEIHPFTCEEVELYNSYGDYTYMGWSYYGWDGWSASNMTDTTTPGYTNEFSAITGGGVCGSTNYGVAYMPDYSYFGSDPATEVFRRAPIELAETAVDGRFGLYITNTTYTYLAMRDGCSPARAFSAENDDYLLLTITGLDDQGQAIADLDPVDFYLADFRQLRDPGDIEGDYIVDRWTWVDLASLVAGGADQLQFLMTSTDTDPELGVNTPLYFAVDNVPSIPGDADGSGTVDDADAAILADHWGESNDMRWAEGDFNGDGAVNAIDASIMAANWGQTAEGVATPEPGLFMLMLGSMVMFVSRRQSRR